MRKADWSRFEHLPLFRAANRINAYNTYLLMEQGGQMKRRHAIGRRWPLASAAGCSLGAAWAALLAAPAAAAAQAVAWPEVTLLDGSRCGRGAGRGPGRWWWCSGPPPARSAAATTHMSKSCTRRPRGGRWRCWAWRATATPPRCSATAAQQGYNSR